MTDYNDIVIVPEVYDNWPQEISDCWISISYLTPDGRSVSKIVKNNEYPPKTVQFFMSEVPMNQIIGRAEWLVEEGIARISLLELEPPYRGHGVGKWFVILLRTHVAKHLGHKIMPPKEGTVDYLTDLLKEIAEEYDEATLLSEIVSWSENPAI